MAWFLEAVTSRAVEACRNGAYAPNDAILPTWGEAVDRHRGRSTEMLLRAVTGRARFHCDVGDDAGLVEEGVACMVLRERRRIDG